MKPVRTKAHPGERPDFAPEVWAQEPGAWAVLEAAVDNGGIDLHHHQAKVPFPFTIVQEHIRLHEAHHVLVTRHSGWRLQGNPAGKPIPNRQVRIEFAANGMVTIAPVERVTGCPVVPVAMGVLEKMIEENRVDAVALQGGINVFHRHDLVKEDHAQCANGRDAVLWYLQFAPTALSPRALAAGTVRPRKNAAPNITANFERARAALRQFGVSTNAVNRAVLEIWAEPTDATCQKVLADLEAIIPVPTPQPKAPQPSAPGEGGGSPSEGDDTAAGGGEQGEGGGDEKSEQDATDDGEANEGDEDDATDDSGDDAADDDADDDVDTPPVTSDDFPTGGTVKGTSPDSCGARVEIDLFEKQADGSWRRQDYASEQATRIANEELAREAQEVGDKLLQDWKDAHAKKDAAEEDRRQLSRSRATLAKERNQLTKSFVIERVILPGNKVHVAASPGGATQKGEELRQVSRWWNDKAIFRSRKPGGTVVIDCSGSMSWDWSQFRAAIVALPSATIGLYCGASDVPDRDVISTARLLQRGQMHGERARNTGKMIVIAEKGRWCDPDTVLEGAKFTGGNAVDLEVLEWLSHQPGPRVWLGDGEIHSGKVSELTALHGKEYVASHVRAIMRQARIVRTNEVNAAVEYLTTNGRSGINGIREWNDQTLLHGFYRVN